MRNRDTSKVSQTEKRRRRRQALNAQYNRWCVNSGANPRDWQSRILWHNERRHFGARRRDDGRLNWRRAAKRGV